jgi:hypothetical protein
MTALSRVPTTARRYPGVHGCRSSQVSTSTGRSEATTRVPGLKVAVPLAAELLPRDRVPSDGPAGEPVLELVREGGSLRARAKLNGKNDRKLLKPIAAQGAENVAIVLQGVLMPAAAPGGPFVLAEAGFQVNRKAPRRAGPAREPPGR